MISNYNSFSQDFLLENIINESIIYYSPELRAILKRMGDNSISKDLLEVEATDIKPDITFVDLDKEGYLSFSTMRNAKRYILDKFPNLDYIDTKPDKEIADELFDLDKRSSSRATEVTKKSRNSVSIGRFINKILPDKYSDKDREEFVNSFKASVDKVGEVFKIVEGDDIAFWYSSENYKEKTGTLGNSCMANKKGIFEIYTKNPEVCRMLILVEDGKLIGRALVWRLQHVRLLGKNLEGVEYFMDRQYTLKDSDVQKFRNYAIQQKWAFKTFNNHHSYETITFEGKDSNVWMTVKLDRTEDYDRFPYMDTFRRLDTTNMILHNDAETDSEYEGQYILDDTGGGYTEIEGGVYSEWYDRTIPDDEAVWSEGVNSYLLRDRAVEITTATHRRYLGWWPEDCDEAVYDEDRDEYIHEEDSVYSEYYDRNMYVEDTIEVITEIYEGDFEKNILSKRDRDVLTVDNYQDMIWYKKMSESLSDFEHTEGILKSIMTKNYNDEWIPDFLVINTCRVSEQREDVSIPSDITGTDYLSEVDAYVLGYTVDKYDENITDQYEYNESIGDLLPEILKKAKFEEKNLRLWIDENSQNADSKEYNLKSKMLSKIDTRIEELEKGTFD